MSVVAVGAGRCAGEWGLRLLYWLTLLLLLLEHRFKMPQISRDEYPTFKKSIVWSRTRTLNILFFPFR